VAVELLIIECVRTRWKVQIALRLCHFAMYDTVPYLFRLFAFVQVPVYEIERSALPIFISFSATKLNGSINQ